MRMRGCYTYKQVAIFDTKNGEENTPEASSGRSGPFVSGGASPSGPSGEGLGTSMDVIDRQAVGWACTATDEQGNGLLRYGEEWSCV